MLCPRRQLHKAGSFLQLTQPLTHIHIIPPIILRMRMDIVKVEQAAIGEFDAAAADAFAGEPLPVEDAVGLPAQGEPLEEGLLDGPPGERH